MSTNFLLSVFRASQSKPRSTSFARKLEFFAFVLARKTRNWSDLLFEKVDFGSINR